VAGTDYILIKNNNRHKAETLLACSIVN